jgi:hypothetical protein
LERGGKLALFGISALYAFGLLIENIHLGRCGITDLALVKPRYVLIGLAFFVYIAIPFVLVTIPFAVFRAFSFLSIALRVGLAIFMFVIVSWIITVPFSYFLTTYTPDDVRFRLPFPAWGVNVGFWKIYRHYQYGGGALFSYLVLLVFNTFKIRAARALSLVLFWYAISIPLWLLVPYSWIVSPNIDSSVGGAAPFVVKVKLKARDADAAPANESDKSDERLGSSLELILWHTDAKFVYLGSCSPLTDPFLVKAVPLDNIVELDFVPARLGFDTGSHHSHPQIVHILRPKNDRQY